MIRLLNQIFDENEIVYVERNSSLINLYSYDNEYNVEFHNEKWSLDSYRNLKKILRENFVIADYGKVILRSSGLINCENVDDLQIKLSYDNGKEVFINFLGEFERDEMKYQLDLALNK